MKINTDNIDPRAFCLDDVFIKVLKLQQKEQLSGDNYAEEFRMTDSR